MVSRYMVKLDNVGGLQGVDGGILGYRVKKEFD